MLSQSPMVGDGGVSVVVVGVDVDVDVVEVANGVEELVADRLGDRVPVAHREAGLANEDA
jgi:hypothetical protein